MFGQHPLSDTVRALRAIATNQIARFAPRSYVMLTGETGRGSASATEQSIAQYFSRCLDDYFEKLGLSRTTAGAWLAGKHVLEYGPGDIPGMALLFVAYGAERVTCVDRFALVRQTEFNRGVIRALLGMLDGEQRARAESCFAVPGDIDSGFNTARLRYSIRGSGLSGERGSAALIISRAVLEHVNDLPATFIDMRQALTADGVALHLVDLKSHGLHQSNPLDFLTWPEWLWRLMYNAKGVPNRLRPDAYRAAAAAAGLEILNLSHTGLVPQELVVAVRPHLAARFRRLGDDDLSWQGFWITLRVAQRP